MNQRVKKNGLLILVLSIFSILNYHPQLLLKLNSPHWGWIFSMLATFLICSFMSRIEPVSWKQKLGIDFRTIDIGRFLIVLLVLLVISYFLVGSVSSMSGYDFKFKLFYYREYLEENYPFHYILANYVYYIPQTFNEEMIVGALLLFGLEKRFRKLNKNYIAILTALIFSLMHQAMYKFSPVQSGALLTMTTILSLFFVGVLRNSLILKTRNISLSWAIHLSFNLIFFSGLFIDVQTGVFPVEPKVFNIVFGNIPMLTFTGILAGVSLIWLNIHAKNKNKG